MTWTRLGVRYQKVRSRPSRWGPSKVHVARYSAGTHGWEPICDTQSSSGPFSGRGYRTIEDEAIVTCKKCVKQDYWKRNKDRSTP